MKTRTDFLAAGVDAPPIDDATRDRARRTVAHFAADAGECADLLAMLGIGPEQSAVEPVPTEGQRKASYYREVKERRRGERVEIDGRLVHPKAPHGTGNGYRWYLCRCEPCAEAGRKESAAKYEKQRQRQLIKRLEAGAA